MWRHSAGGARRLATGERRAGIPPRTSRSRAGSTGRLEPVRPVWRAPSRVASRTDPNRDESDQSSEDTPPEEIHQEEEEREGAGGDAEENAGVPNEAGQATGNPAARADVPTLIVGRSSAPAAYPSSAVLEPVKPILRAGAAALFVVGTILFLVNPPSLSGAEDLIAVIAGGCALALLTAWATVALRGRDEITEPEFERVVERTETLAQASSTAREPTDFERIVGEAIERLPEEFRSLLDEVPVVVSRRGRETRAYGHYFGDTVARGAHEDRIVVYQDTLERDFGHDPALLADQVERTLRHEVAHHLGWEERGVRDLGL